ncbi:MAG TPA: hypothetical protein VGM22_08055 [Methylomirabilota bacterium]|jgi:hypothetical protein
MEGVIPYGVGMLLILSSVAVLAMGLVVLITFLWSTRRSDTGGADGRMCEPSDIPTTAEVEEFVRSLTPEDFAAAEKFAADFRRANGWSDS